RRALRPVVLIGIDDGSTEKTFGNAFATAADRDRRNSLAGRRGNLVVLALETGIGFPAVALRSCSLRPRWRKRGWNWPQRAFRKQAASATSCSIKPTLALPSS